MEGAFTRSMLIDFPAEDKPQKKLFPAGSSTCLIWQVVYF